LGRRRRTRVWRHGGLDGGSRHRKVGVIVGGIILKPENKYAFSSGWNLGFWGLAVCIMSSVSSAPLVRQYATAVEAGRDGVDRCNLPDATDCFNGWSAVEF